LFGAQFQLPYLARINATIERLLDFYVWPMVSRHRYADLLQH
jgi:hypothetical protein